MIEHELAREGFKLSGVLTVEINDAKSGVRLSRWQNKIVDAGLNLARDLLGGGNYPVSHIAVGTGTTAPVAGDTTLETEVFRKALTATDFDPQKVTFTMFLDTGEANGNTLTEGGLFNAFAAGDMFSRVLIVPSIVKDASITATLTWEITVARA